MAPRVEDADFIAASEGCCCDEIWESIRKDVDSMLQENAGGLDPAVCELLPEVLSKAILNWNSFEEALSAHLSAKLSWSAAPQDRWHKLLLAALKTGSSQEGQSLGALAKKDLSVIKERDPACPSLAHAFLHFKGFQGLQVYRVANWLWRNGQKSLASVLQSRISEVFGMDIHPAAQLGRGIMIDHATGLVIGETAVVGDGCTLLHGVTLGGTGKQHGDRHPKIGSNVLVGAGASILGNVRIGNCAKIGAAAVVLSSIPDYATAVGSPAKVIGRAKEENPASNMDHACKQVDMYSSRFKVLCPFRSLDLLKQGYLGPYEFANRLRNLWNINISQSDAYDLFFKMDSDHDGQLTEKEFNENVNVLIETLKSSGKLNHSC
ncbi:hypothetical protein O6H91_15G056000 [Diphasiastrum complanatum]|uniref:Uncharacterized protein n=1 Tax=Diphasiastrum complanatum TaxID=34168 RepID=A0ACC2BJC3_DIPCM|nr:hypothetical protein O6H91_Y474300 [Diphasiastrum complanatum]KAJ7214161.1 hypothetical protein O6H91_Y474300 [Diphasiastrum complanatum]KAJ7529539.1 hypothetical protein O6H91_15G056000 [Diphasiastrum complanatum]